MREGDFTCAQSRLSGLLSGGAVVLVLFFFYISFKILSACHSRGSLLVHLVPL